MAEQKSFKPRSVRTRGAIKELIGPGQMGGVGKVDYEQSDSEAAAGMFTRRLVADPPGGFIFECHCGHKRRVTGEETNFFCERGGWTDGKTECQIVWSRKRVKVEGEFDEEGRDVYEDVTEQETIEVPDEYTGKKRKVKIDVPVFEGRFVGDVKKAEFARRKAAGEEVQAQPTNTVIQTTYGQKNDGETPADKVKGKK